MMLCRKWVSQTKTFLNVSLLLIIHPSYPAMHICGEFIFSPRGIWCVAYSGAGALHISHAAHMHTRTHGGGCSNNGILQKSAKVPTASRAAFIKPASLCCACLAVGFTLVCYVSMLTVALGAADAYIPPTTF